MRKSHLALLSSLFLLGAACSGKTDKDAEPSASSGSGGASSSASSGSGSGGSKSSGGSAGTSSTGTGGTSSGSGTGGSDAGTGGAGTGGSGGAEGCACDTNILTWGMDGGYVLYNDSSELIYCGAYARMRMPTGGGEPLFCTQGVASCPADVMAALEHPDVQAAFDKAPVLYGVDMRPLDGQVFQINGVIEVGSPCDGAGGCTPIPDGITALVDALQALDEVELARGECAEVFD